MDATIRIRLQVLFSSLGGSRPQIPSNELYFKYYSNPWQDVFFKICKSIILDYLNTNAFNYSNDYFYSFDLQNQSICWKNDPVIYTVYHL